MAGTRARRSVPPARSTATVSAATSRRGSTEWSPGASSAAPGTRSENTPTPCQDFNAPLAKESILNSFIFTMDSKAKILNQQLGLAFYGYPADYYGKFISGIQQVTADDVARQ